MGTDKALLSWPPRAAEQTHSSQTPSSRAPSNQTFLSAAIRSFALSTDFVVVVAGKNQAVVAPVAYAAGASVVVNPDPDRGQFSSLQAGLHEVLNRGRDAAMITLVDHPPVGRDTIQRLREAFESAAPNIWAVVPEFSGKHGHPYLVGRELIEVFLQAPPSTIARDLEHSYQEHIQYVTVDDPFVALNINTPDEYAALIAIAKTS